MRLLIISENVENRDYFHQRVIGLMKLKAVEVCASLEEAKYELIDQPYETVMIDEAFSLAEYQPFIARLKTKYPHLTVIMAARGACNVTVAQLKADQIDQLIECDGLSDAGLQRVFDQLLNQEEQADKQRKNQKSFELMVRRLLHDIRAPIRQIGGFSDIIASELVEQKYEKLPNYFGFIKTAATDMGRLVDGLAAYVKLDQYEDSEQVDLQLLAERIANKLNAQEASPAFTLQAKALPVIETNRVLIGLLFENLIGNAVLYHQEKSAQVTIVASVLDNALRLEFSDNNEAIEPTMSEEIFEPFVRLASGTKTRRAGMGLAICKRIAKLLGGNIALMQSMNNEESGNKFVISFPLLTKH